MDHIKVTKVPDVTAIRLGLATLGTLHLTTHHMIFRQNGSSKEIWICYPIIADVERRPYSPIHGHSSMRIRCRDFTFIAFNFKSESQSKDVFESIMKLTCVSTVERLYGFIYKPGSLEKGHNGWNIFDPIKEYERMGAFKQGKWRFTNVNKDYALCPSYPSTFVVPEAISDNVLNYAAKYRSKSRIPALSYYHEFNSCTITRCSQPMVGIKQNRSVQDEKFISAIFSTTQVPEKIGAMQENLIVDARPTTNAMAQTALGAGTENMEYYKGAKKVYLGIDNIHVMRDSLNKVVETLKNGDVSPLPPSQELLYKSNWLKHTSIILEGAVLVAQQVHYKFSHVLVHCSDGWDRTSQISSLAQIFLDPYCRTLDGFITLVEKEWLCFGYRFAERAGHLSNEKHFVQIGDNNQAQQVFNSVSHKLVKQSHIKYTSPVFHQFLDCVYQLLRQFPSKFEYNERFLRRLLYHNYSCQYGTFLYNCERERKETNVETRTRSVWDYFIARRHEFISDKYEPAPLDSGEIDVILADAKDVKWWPEVFGRTEQEMNPPQGALYSTSPLPTSPIPSSFASTPLPSSPRDSLGTLQTKIHSSISLTTDDSIESRDKSFPSVASTQQTNLNGYITNTNVNSNIEPLGNAFVRYASEDEYSPRVKRKSNAATINTTTIAAAITDSESNTLNGSVGNSTIELSNTATRFETMTLDVSSKNNDVNGHEVFSRIAVEKE